MAGNLESIRAGRGLLPKNLHWFIVAAVLMGMLVALGLHSNKKGAGLDARRAQAQRTEAASLAKQTPDVNAIIDEGARELESPKPEKAPKKPEVPAVEQADVGRQIASAASGAGEGSAERYAQGARATSPIIVLSGEAKPVATKAPSDRDLILRSLIQQPQPPALSSEDGKLLASVERGGAQVRVGPAKADSGYLGQAERNDAWYKRLAAERQSEQPKSIGLSPPVGPYTIVQGTPIPAVTVTPIDSDLPGQIVARTTEDTYDSVSGRYLLIPAGSLVYGQYNNSVIVGQDRLAVVFERIIFPDGAGVSLGAMPGVDAAGSAGVKGEINNHFWKVFGSSILIAGLAALVEPRANVNVYVGGGSQAVNTAGQVLSQVTQQIMQRNTVMPPTVTVKDGQSFDILVQRDLALGPYTGRR